MNSLAMDNRTPVIYKVQWHHVYKMYSDQCMESSARGGQDVEYL